MKVSEGRYCVSLSSSETITKKCNNKRSVIEIKSTFSHAIVAITSLISMPIKVDDILLKLYIFFPSCLLLTCYHMENSYYNIQYKCCSSLLQSHDIL